ncbi:MAG: hypothetical protein EAZ47_03270 [Bacteroidetes bacterium]|nr:MAG: hypothetical protein EAY72_13160 [Bacteroidota bacterium]TAF95416.1 MAG: hypothetical protein EAZ47_03270 [Bacteroidota bacterium]
MYRWYSTFSTLVLVFITLVSGHAQLNFTVQSNAQALAQRIVGTGVTISNATFRGNGASAGFFSGNNQTVGIGNGIVLTTGRVVNGGGFGIANQASILATSGNGGSAWQDADLSALSGGKPTRDACVLEFDFVPIGDSISVNFVFASEEYPDFNCTRFNDVFGFLISGPGFNGPTNIALVPGTNVPVTINSINNGVPGQNGNLDSCTSAGPGAPFTRFYVDNSASTQIVYDGFTTVLTAKARVQACQSYHIKLAIADAFDDRYDSGVFIESNSFSSNGISLTKGDGYNDGPNATLLAVEGCRNAIVQLQRPKSIAQGSTTVFLTYGGTAAYGVDYSPAPTSILFAPGDTLKNIIINALADNQPEPNETLTIYLSTSACVGRFSDSITLEVRDSFGLYSAQERQVCSGNFSTLTAQTQPNATNTYVWSTGATTRSIQVNTVGTYWVRHYFNANCFNKDTFLVTSGDPQVNIGPPDTLLCRGQILTLTAGNTTNGNSFLWNTGDVTPSIPVRETGMYHVKVTTPLGCILNDTTHAVFNVVPRINLGRDTALCAYDSLTLNAFFRNGTYAWSTGDTSRAITVYGTQPGRYFVTVTARNCTNTDTILVAAKRMPVADAGPADITILRGGYARLVATRGANNARFRWSPRLHLSADTVFNPIASPKQEMYYRLQVTSQDGCVQNDSILVKINPNFFIPNAFSPNGDGINDKWEIPLIASYIYANVQVFNRFGTLVYSTLGYEKPWDGTTNTGQPVPAGTYYYYIEPGNGIPTVTGWLQVFR